MTALSALAAAAFAPPEDAAIPDGLEAALRLACAGAWRAIEVVLAGDVLRGRIAKTRDTIVRDAVEGILELHGNVGIRAEALAALREARDAGELDGPLDLAAVVAGIRQEGAVAAGRGALSVIRRELADRRELEQALADAELASLLVDCARATLRHLARGPELTRWAIGPTGSPGRDRALAAFAELAASPESIAELEKLIAVPIHLDDNVQFTVYRPRAIDPGKWHQLLAFAHLAERRPGEDDLPDPVEEVQRQAASVLGAKAQQYQPVVQDSGAAIPQEGELTFVPEFAGIEVNPPRRSFLWLETVHREEFRIRAPRDLDGKTVRGRVTVFLGHIAIAEVALSVRVDAQPAAQDRKREPTHARAYRKIFASYSHRDLEIVNQFETYARALGDEYLRDWVHLRTGEVWNDRLCQLIDQSDAFQLFWSRNSMHSKFVRQEYEYALSLNRPSFVRPTYWEDPMPAAPGLPPEALLRLHFQKLSAAMIGDATARTDHPPVIARSKRAKDAKEELAIDRERAHSLSDTDQWAHEAEHDVTDPTFALPESAALDEEASSDNVTESRRRAVSAPKNKTSISEVRPRRPNERVPDPVAAEQQAKLDDDSLDTPREPDRFAAPPAAQPRPSPAASSSRVGRPGGTMPPPAAAPSIAPPASGMPAPSGARSSTSTPVRPAPGPSAPAPSPSAPSAPMRPGPSAPGFASRPAPAPAVRPEPAAAKPVFTRPTASAIPPRMPAPDWDVHQAAALPPPIDARHEVHSTEPAPFDTLVSERRQGFDEALVPDEEAKMDPKRIATSPGVGPAKPAKIPHTNPHASPPPPVLGALCATCQSHNRVDARFCEKCGSAMGVTARPAQPAGPSSRAPSAPVMPEVAELAQLGATPSVPVSPYAPTVPSEAYQPTPDDVVYATKLETIRPKLGSNASRPESARNSVLPILLVVVGAIIVIAVIVAWLLR